MSVFGVFLVRMQIIRTRKTSSADTFPAVLVHMAFWKNALNLMDNHCLKIVQTRSFPGPYFPAFGLNTKIYGVNLRFQSKYWKIWTRKLCIWTLFTQWIIWKTKNKRFKFIVSKNMLSVVFRKVFIMGLLF